jgi:NAD(P)-dependent dehydrogenase (short-subunit alcohol dehydrogenase family)
MSKAAANMMSVLLANELKAKGIAVGIFHPGFNKTGMVRVCLIGPWRILIASCSPQRFCCLTRCFFTNDFRRLPNTRTFGNEKVLSILRSVQSVYCTRPATFPWRRPESLSIAKMG